MSPKKILLTVLTGALVIGGLYMLENPGDRPDLPFPNESTSNGCEDLTNFSGNTYNYSQLEEKCNCLNGTLKTRDVNRSNTSNIYCKI